MSGPTVSSSLAVRCCGWLSPVVVVCVFAWTRRTCRYGNRCISRSRATGSTENTDGRDGQYTPGPAATDLVRYPAGFWMTSPYTRKLLDRAQPWRSWQGGVTALLVIYAVWLVIVVGYTGRHPHNVFGYVWGLLIVVIAVTTISAWVSLLSRPPPRPAPRCGREFELTGPSRWVLASYCSPIPPTARFIDHLSPSRRGTLIQDGDVPWPIHLQTTFANAVVIQRGRVGA